jgi:predicted MFS family arabinose efflux permease
MGGLALGSFVGGRIADKIEKPLKLYALLEIGIAGVCIFIPIFFQIAQTIYIFFTLSCKPNNFCF